jgi:hypothetical protein
MPMGGRAERISPRMCMWTDIIRGSLFDENHFQRPFFGVGLLHEPLLIVNLKKEEYFSFGKKKKKKKEKGKKKSANLIVCAHVIRTFSLFLF